MQFSDKKIIGFTVALALFMDALDTTIINTAIPAMARSLNVYPVDLKISLISYLLSLAIFIPISGWVADKYGIKRAFIFALGIFTLSSLWCGFVQQLYELVIARSIQGLGGALMLPLGRLIILRSFKRHELVEAMNAVVMVVSLGLMLGPFAGGFITDHFSWHWIFWINIPVGMLAILIASYALKDVAPAKVKPLDLIGFILFGGGLAALTFSLSDLSETTANPLVAWLIMSAAILMLLAYYFHAKRQLYPIINLKLLQFRTFRISVLGNLLTRLGFGGVPFLLPLLLQVALNFSAQLSGLLLVPVALGILVVKTFSLKLLRFFGYKRLLLLNNVLVALSLLSFQLIGIDTSVYFIGCLTFIFGFLISLQYSGMNSLAYSQISNDELSAATSIMSTMQQLAQSFGVAAGALLLRHYSWHHHLTPYVFHKTFFAMAVITLLSTFIFIRLNKADGHEMLTVPAQDKISVH